MGNIKIRIGNNSEPITVTAAAVSDSSYGEIPVPDKKIKDSCSGQESKCKVWIQYQNDPDKEWVELRGTLDVKSVADKESDFPE